MNHQYLLQEIFYLFKEKYNNNNNNKLLLLLLFK